MECPKCHNEVDENTAVCPFCKKVLLLKCPVCGKYNKNTVCEDCGFTIISKCNNCGKINQTIDKVCPKCGLDTYKSIALNEAETEEFACMVITFSNLRDMKNALNSVENYNKFYKKLKKLIFDFSAENKIKTTLSNGNFIAYFYRDYSFHASALNSVKTVINFVDKIVNLNSKLKKVLGIALDCKIVLVKKTIDDISADSQTSGLNIKLLNLKNEKDNYLAGIQVIVDQSIYKPASKDYEMTSLYSTQVGEQLMSFYELMLTKYVAPPVEEDDEDAFDYKAAGLPDIKRKTSEIEEEKDLYNFDEINIEAPCKFIQATSAMCFPVLEENLDQYRIISIKSPQNLYPDTYEIFEKIKGKGQSIIHLRCLERLQCNAFGFWREFLKSYTDLERNSAFKLRIKTKLPDTDALLDLIDGKMQEDVSPESIRFKYFEAIYSVIQNIEDKLVLFIENFNMMDSTSLELFKLIFSRIEDTNVTFVITSDRNVSLHKKIEQLLRYDKYLEISLKKSSWAEILNCMPAIYDDFINSFFFEKIKENYNGSYTYVINAILYLIESRTLVVSDEKGALKEEKITVLPEDLVDLMQKRIRLLAKETDAYNVLLYSYFLGSRIDVNVFKLLGITDFENVAKVLEEHHFIGVFRASIYIQNYKILTKAIEKMYDDEYMKKLAENLYNKVYASSEKPSSIKLSLLSALDMKKEMYAEHIKLSQVALSYGDFSAYIKNAVKFITIMSGKKKQNDAVLEEFKTNIYNYAANYLDSTFDEEAKSIINVLLEDAVENNDKEKIINLSKITLKNALASSDYPLALIALHNILTNIEDATIIDSHANYNSKFLSLLLINIEILFNLGELNKCLEIAQALLSELTPEICQKMKPESYSMEQYENYLLETMTLAALAKLMTCEKDLIPFLNEIKYKIGRDIPCKDTLLAIKFLLMGEKPDIQPAQSDEVYTKILNSIISAFLVYNGDYVKLAQNIHVAKLIASNEKQLQFNLFCDLIIGYCYYRLGVTEKSDFIYNDVLNRAKECGLATVVHLTNYFVGLADIEANNPDAAYGVIMNSLLIIEKSNSKNRIILSMLQLLLLKIMNIQEQNMQNVNSETDDGEISDENSDEMSEEISETEGEDNEVKEVPKHKFSKEILDTPDGYKLIRLSEEYGLKPFMENLI
ncbi:hypothetical protein IJI31_05720 [bacterium]|nr:hypothetical protein [bacterium]